eukprot:TRINITY_DN2058_c0_g1_i1.p1 TRINITY_DN2058_c0_g1~~TRINITY_DN2058_c0_g1_i1.p1  ORF type:complete len:407 (+),score=102.84 TRINITY_DN2058_c0_g1_i1:91-1311(+)
MNRGTGTYLLPLFVFLCGLLIHHATAFNEDVCFDDGKMIDCASFDPKCPPGEESYWCRTKITTKWAYNTRNSKPRGRSMVHVEGTYFIALSLGYDPTFAYYLAAYNEAADHVTYTHVDKCGKPVDDPKWVTAAVKGFDRVWNCAGGTEYHVPTYALSIPYSPGKVTYGEALKQMRRWAFRQSDLLCIDGLTEPVGGKRANLTTADYFGGTRCYCNGTGLDRCPYTLISREVALFFEKEITFQGITGLQVMSYDSKDKCKMVNPRYTDQYQQIVDEAVGRLPDGSSVEFAARFGPYLHLGADSFSHNECVLGTKMTGPDSQGRFKIVQNATTCAQALHALRHYFETGHSVPSPHTISALSWMYDELLLWKTQFNTTQPQFFNQQIKIETPKSQVMKWLTEALFLCWW